MELIIGSHVSLSGKDMLLGSVKEALGYHATTFMFYTGAPQNTKRKPISEFKVEEAKEVIKNSPIVFDNIVVHAPYIINLGNTIKLETRELAISFLKEEIQRVEEIGLTRLVLHPGAHVKAGEEVGLKAIVDGLNEVLLPSQNVIVCLETMAGKGTELGKTIDELKYIFDHVILNEKLGLCLDTCHLSDAGYDITHFDDILDEIDQKIGLDKVKVIHVNDSKNPQGAHKDRHENIGYGYLGFEALDKIVHNERLKDVPKILETPYIEKHAPYKEEIDMFVKRSFDNTLK